MDLDAGNMTGTLLRATKCGSLDPKDAMMQTCSAGSISSPQALVYLQGSSAIGGDLLLIYEASERKAVNMVWSWDLLSRQLIPVFHGHYDAKLGGASFHPDINGYAYIGVSVMSPYARHEDLAGVAETSGTNSWWGTIGPIQVSCWRLQGPMRAVLAAPVCLQAGCIQPCQPCGAAGQSAALACCCSCCCRPAQLRGILQAAAPCTQLDSAASRPVTACRDCCSPFWMQLHSSRHQCRG
jgi:hypothetical protein